jgi:hypothetical protein
LIFQEDEDKVGDIIIFNFYCIFIVLFFYKHIGNKFHNKYIVIKPHGSSRQDPQVSLSCKIFNDNKLSFCL